MFNQAVVVNVSCLSKGCVCTIQGVCFHLSTRGRLNPVARGVLLHFTLSYGSGNTIQEADRGAVIPTAASC